MAESNRHYMGRGLASILLGAGLAFGGFGVERAYAQDNNGGAYRWALHVQNEKPKTPLEAAEDLQDLLAVDAANARRAKQEKQYRDLKSLLEKNLQNSQNQQAVQQNSLENITEQPATNDDNVKIFTCNYCLDFQDRNEYVGVKDRFKEGEMMKIVVNINNYKEKNCRLEIWGPKGEKVYDNETDVSYDITRIGAEGPKANWTKELLEKGGVGSYKAITYIDGKYVASHDFEIYESTQKTAKSKTETDKDKQKASKGKDKAE